jgi:cytochrome c peroxidase
MKRHLWFLTGGLLGLAVAGCGGAGTEPGATANFPETPVAANATTSGDTVNVPAGDQTAPKVTPASGIDPKTLVDVVKEEVQGGEMTAGPSPRDYLWQPSSGDLKPDEPLEVNVPAGLPSIVGYVPASNPMTKAKWELGRQLYFEPRISKDATVSCATCHNPEIGWTDGMPSSTGIKGQVGSRSAPTVLNTVYGKSMFWDGRAPSLEAQAQGPPQNPIEMGEQSYQEIVERLRAIPGYQEQFRRVFGTDVTLDGIAKAIGCFERTALSGNSPYDRYVGGELSALDETQKNGMVLFGLRLNPDDPYQAEGVTLKKAMCTSCHVGANFTDEQFHNLGVGWNAEKKAFDDLGRWAVTPIGAKDNRDLGAFKTPTLRDIARTGPYMHDGSEMTLEQVVEYYDRGGNANPSLDPDMKPLKLTKDEVKAVVAFMEALTGEIRKVELPKLPPGPDGTAPDPAKALEPPSKPETSARDAIHGMMRRG